ncbi:GNAT family N-acetyltransferase [Flavobacterium sp.]|uniref:GNAT family N-acetyltransferase n=1 Tax=Flavobacterium sp. TaxID=239 RepID=UPI0025C580C2|nr:GNAT family N-acetyltransferase [Flavobacterium sp.]
MTTTYNPISSSDIETIVAMMVDFYAIDGYPIDVEKSKLLFDEFISDEKLGKAWLIEYENKTVGYVILTFVFNFEYGGKIAFVDELYIKDEMRGKGIGKDAIDFVKQQAVEIGLKLLYLEVEPHNSTAQKLYLDKGFAMHSRQLMLFKF